MLVVHLCRMEIIKEIKPATSSDNSDGNTLTKQITFSTFSVLCRFLLLMNPTNLDQKFDEFQIKFVWFSHINKNQFIETIQNINEGKSLGDIFSNIDTIVSSANYDKLSATDIQIIEIIKKLAKQKRKSSRYKALSIFNSKLHDLKITQKSNNSINLEIDVVKSSRYLDSALCTELNNVNALCSVPISQVSPTSLEIYAQCPMRFFIKKLAGFHTFKDDQNELSALRYGSLIHKCLEAYIADDLTQDDLIGYAIVQLEHLHDIGIIKNKSYLDFLVKRTTNILNQFFKLSDKDKSKISPEVSIEKTIKGISIKGKVDRIQSNCSKTKLVDYKTSRATPNESSFNFGREFQLAIYALIVGDVDEIEYWHLSENNTSIKHIEWNEENKAKAKSILETLLDSINSGIFIPRQESITQNSTTIKSTSYCDSCEFTHGCFEQNRLLWSKHKASYRQLTCVLGENQISDTL